MHFRVSDHALSHPLMARRSVGKAWSFSSSASWLMRSNEALSCYPVQGPTRRGRDRDRGQRPHPSPLRPALSPALRQHANPGTGACLRRLPRPHDLAPTYRKHYADHCLGWVAHPWVKAKGIGDRLRKTGRRQGGIVSGKCLHERDDHCTTSATPPHEAEFCPPYPRHRTRPEQASGGGSSRRAGERAID